MNNHFISKSNGGPEINGGNLFKKMSTEMNSSMTGVMEGRRIVCF